MKTPDDLDRLLGDWLQEGPTRAPEAPLDEALQHARSNPRRRDPLAFLRRDPMARRAGWLGLQPVPVLALLGLLLAAMVAVIAIGSQNNRSPIVIPSESPSPVVSSPTPSAVPTFHLELKDEFDSGATVDIVDRSGTVVSARAAEIGEREPNPGAPSTGDVTVQNVDASTLWISWGSGACPDAHVLTIDPDGRSMSISQPPFCGGDTVGVGRALVVTFAGPIDAADVAAEIVDAEGASPSPGSP